MTWNEVEEYRDIEWYETAISNGTVEFIINSRKSNITDVLAYMDALEACAEALRNLVAQDNDYASNGHELRVAEEALARLDSLRGEK